MVVLARLGCNRIWIWIDTLTAQILICIVVNQIRLKRRQVSARHFELVIALVEIPLINIFFLQLLVQPRVRVAEVHEIVLTRDRLHFLVVNLPEPLGCLDHHHTRWCLWLAVHLDLQLSWLHLAWLLGFSVHLGCVAGDLGLELLDHLLTLLVLGLEGLILLFEHHHVILLRKVLFFQRLELLDNLLCVTLLFV